VVRLIFGAVLILVGAYGLFGAQPFVHWAARLWPRPRRGDRVGNLVAVNFIIRFLGLLVAAAGVALVAAYFAQG
jgi:hypothetical protein